MKIRFLRYIRIGLLGIMFLYTVSTKMSLAAVEDTPVPPYMWGHGYNYDDMPDDFYGFEVEIIITTPSPKPLSTQTPSETNTPTPTPTPTPTHTPTSTPYLTDSNSHLADARLGSVVTTPTPSPHPERTTKTPSKPPAPSKQKTRSPTHKPSSTPRATLPPNCGNTTVVNGDMELFTGPGDEYSRTATLRTGESLVALGMANAQWLEVLYEDRIVYVDANKADWDFQEEVRLKTREAAILYQNTDDTDGLSLIPADTTLSITGRHGLWFSVNVKGVIYYVSKDAFIVPSMDVR